MILKEKTILINGEIKADVYAPQTREKFPAVALMHGFKGFRRWGFFPFVSRRIAESGAISICFDFLGNGIADEEKALFDVDVFAANSISQELEDAALALNSIENGEIDDNFSEKWNSEIYLLGHSLGGGIALLTAAERVSSVDKIALWAPVATFDRYSARQKQQWKRKGAMTFTNNSTGQILRMDAGYLDDFERAGERFNLLIAASNLDLPVLIIAGESDLSVKPKECERLYKNFKHKDAELFVIEKTGHTFGAVHPFEGESFALKTAIDKTINFFNLTR